VTNGRTTAMCIIIIIRGVSWASPCRFFRSSSSLKSVATFTLYRKMLNKTLPIIIILPISKFESDDDDDEDVDDADDEGGVIPAMVDINGAVDGSSCELDA
jgi:hypothetical protein